MRNLKKSSLTSKIIAVVLTVSMIASMSATFAFSKYLNAHAGETSSLVGNAEINQLASEEESPQEDGSQNSKESTAEDNELPNDSHVDVLNNISSEGTNEKNTTDEVFDNELNSKDNTLELAAVPDNGSTNDDNVKVWWKFDTSSHDSYVLYLSGTEKEGYTETTDAEYGWMDKIYKDGVDLITLDNKIKPKTTKEWFAMPEESSRHLTSINNLNLLDTSEVTDMSSMFYLDYYLTSIDVSGFNTSKVTDMNNMFYDCKSVDTLDLHTFNTSKVTDMNKMFEGCELLTSLDLSNFDTRNVRNMAYMFYKSGFTRLDLSKFNTSNVTNMADMFANCSNLESLDVSKFNTSSVKDMTLMFFNCWNLTSLDVSNFDTSNVEKISSIFSYCSKLTSLDLSNWDTSKVADMDQMFYYCSGLTSLDISGFNTEGVVKGATAAEDPYSDISYLFNGCSELTTIYASDKFDVSSVLSNENFNQDSIFVGCDKLVGGEGTKYIDCWASDYTYDKEYEEYSGKDGKRACIDSGVSNAAGYFTFKEPTYTVTLDANGGTIAGATSVTGVSSGSAMPELASNQIPTRFGYTFNGYWDNATEGSGTQYYTTAGKSAKNWDKTANATLYAHWTAVTYSVKFEANAPSTATGTVSGTMANQKLTYDTEANLTENAYTLAGYTFDGWAESATGEVKYADKALVINLASTNDATVSLYAHWTQNSDPTPTPGPVNPDGSTASTSSASTSSTTSTGDSVPVVGLLIVSVVGLAISAIAYCRYRRFSK